MERRRDRYLIIYVWKIIQALAPNLLGHDKIMVVMNLRRGRMCRVPSLNHQVPAYVQTMRENSFSVYGPRLFNSLPREMRDYDGSLAAFKRRLDAFLATVPDKPMLPQHHQCSAGNDLISQLNEMRIDSSMC